MQLVSAMLVTLLRSVLIVALLVGLLFGGTIIISEAGPSVREGLEAPQRLDEIDAQAREHAEISGGRHAEATAHGARRMSLKVRIQRERRGWEERLDEELEAIRLAAEQQIGDVEQNLAENHGLMTESMGRLEAEYCESWNPVDWWACRAVRQRIESVDERMSLQQDAIRETAARLRQQARDDAVAYRQAAEERLAEQTAEFEEQLAASMEAMDDLEQQRRQLEDEVERLRREEAALRDDNWLWIEFQKRWPYLLTVALLIFAAPYLRRTLWYFAGMPLVSKARPIELHEPDADADKPPAPTIEWGTSRRSLDIEIPAGGRLVTRTGYIQSERGGAKSELFFDRGAPNLSYISGLVLLTRLEARQADEESRQVQLATPDDPDSYLMRVDLADHPGVVIRASHVVGVIGDVEMTSSWRLTNLHAWATSQVRFIAFSGTGTLIVEGHGDVDASDVAGGREQKRMPLVIGFDTRLSYSTERTATFLPYLVDPGREPLVVDVFEGDGVVLFEKNPSARKQHRSTGEAIAGFFLDAFRKLLGL